MSLYFWIHSRLEPIEKIDEKEKGEIIKLIKL